MSGKKRDNKKGGKNPAFFIGREKAQKTQKIIEDGDKLPE
jgi:hypothetical protein